ncbi:MAG: PA0069 family radical SAM protein [Cytophagaceae bacterium]|jgi:DNA repair photolyase|nr:PA0069 family radical SAM protein [Cytophagaceae bacterium]
MNIKGRGAQSNSLNPFEKHALSFAILEGIDAPYFERPNTSIRIETPKKIINKVESTDLGFEYSMNPYQGCEHGCIYCYARNTHTYWGYSAGLDFETKILVKRNAGALLEKELMHKNYQVAPIMLSGNTDCYQPIEKKFQLTRKLLEVAWKYQQPLSIITKNALVERDADILQQLASKNLVHVSISITTLNEALRLKLEPRTARGERRLETVKTLSTAGIPVHVMVAPVIPGLNDHEIPEILRCSAEAGALSAAYTMVRLNGAVAELFTEWIEQAFPDLKNKVLNQISEAHGGQLNDSRPGLRMSGEGAMADSIQQLFAVNKEKYFKNRKLPPLNTNLFTKPGQLSLF